MSVIFKALSQLERTPGPPADKPDKGRPLICGRQHLWLGMAAAVAAFLMVGLVWSYQAAGVGESMHGPLENGPADDSRPEVVFRPAAGPAETDFHPRTGPHKAAVRPGPGDRLPYAGGGQDPGGASGSSLATKSARADSGVEMAAKQTAFDVNASPMVRTGKQSAYPGAGVAAKGRQRSEAISRLVVKRRQTAALVSRIRNRLAGGDDPGAAALIKRLADEKGNDDLLVMKLRAYLLIRQAQWSAAEDLLGRVLAIQPDDADAALNMAAVLINTGRLAKARESLERLYRRFPEDDRISQWLERISP